MRPRGASRQWAWRQGAGRVVWSTLAWGMLVAIPAFAAAAGAQANPAALDRIVQADPTDIAGQDDAAARLVVGMHYVVPPFVGGSKVRTPEAIDTALAEELAAKVQAQLLAVPGKTAIQQSAGWKTPEPRLALAAIGPDAKVPASFGSVPTRNAAGPTRPGRGKGKR